MALFLVLALVGFVASVVVHASTFLPVPPLGMDHAWPLHVGIFIVFLPMAFAQGPRNAQGANASRSLREPFSLAPRWMRALLAAVFLYAMLNFFVGVVLMMGASSGKVRPKDGRFMLAPPGAVELQVGRADEDRSQARMFSGYCMVFYLASAAGIIDARRRARAEADARRGTFMPLTAGGSRYTLHPSPRLTPAVHATVMTLLSVTLAGGCSAALVVPLISTANNPNAGAWRHLAVAGLLLSIPLFFVALRGTSVGFARHIAARCPSCGGRAYCDGLLRTRSTDDLAYTCRDCGAASHTNGSPVNPPGLAGLNLPGSAPRSSR